MVARDLAAGPRAALLDDLIVMIAPIFNVDGADTFTVQRGGLGSATPYISGVRHNSQGLDLNREGVKLESVEANGLYRTLNAWDPILFLDGHLTGRVMHGYANTYGTTTVPASASHPPAGRCRAARRKRSTATWTAASSRAASPGCAVASAGTTTWSPFPASCAAFAPRVTRSES